MTDFEINTNDIYVADHPSNRFDVIIITKATKKMVEIKLFYNISGDYSFLEQANISDQKKYKVFMDYNSNDSTCTPAIVIDSYTYPLNWGKKIELDFWPNWFIN